MVAVALSSAHGKLVRGAKGPAPWGLDEVDESRRIVAEVARILATNGVMVRTFNDDSSRTVNANLNAIVSWHQRQTRDFDVSVHLNAFEPTTTIPRGVEVLHRSQQALAAKVSKAIADAGRFVNRGPKQRTNLYLLNNLSAKPTLLLELCFTDSKPDADLYRQHFSAIASAIAEIAGVAVPPPMPPPSARPVVRRGSRGEFVVSVQRTLSLVADGNFGPLTEAAVQEFQRAHGATADGVVGPITWRLLDEFDLRRQQDSDELAAGLADAIDEAITRSAEEVLQPEPDATEVALNIAVKGDVVIKTPDQPIKSEPSDETPEVEIIVRAKGSVAVSVNTGRRPRRRVKKDETSR